MLGMPGIYPRAADGDVEWAERGVVYIDEIDKICVCRDVNGRDASGEGVQQSLLKMLDGFEVMIPANIGGKSSDNRMIMINTKNILFICAGAFVGLEKLKEGAQKGGKIGFDVDVSDDTETEEEEAGVTTEMLIRYS